jgi:2-dehydro-3-deoxygalactonokinase
MSAGHFIGIDWGSTNARAMLFTREGALLEQREFPLGIKNVAAGAHREALHRMTDAWRERFGPMPALLSGMIGSRHGWREAPYLSCPASLNDLAHHLVPIADEPDVLIVPGLKMEGDRPDVMRGEELQVLGLAATGAEVELVCIPGTHSKWILTSGNVLREFHTAMTGELFALTCEHTLLAPLIPRETKTGEFRAAAFDNGLHRSAAPHGLLHALFELRAAVLLGRLAAEDLRDVISGLLISTEIRHVQTLSPGQHRVALLGAPAVSERYAQALRTFGFEPRTFNVQEVTARAFVTLFQAACLAR